MRRSALAAAVAIAWLAAPQLGPVASSAAAAAVPQIRWLAMGDSYSAGEGTTGAGTSDWSGPKTRDHDGTCQRSNHAWAPLAYRAINAGHAVHIARFDFVACTGAVILPLPDSPDVIDQTNNQLTLQLAEAGIQGDRPVAQYDLITFSFGGNDLGFAQIVKDCLGFLADPLSLKPVGCTMTMQDYQRRLAAIRSHLTALIAVVEQKVAPGGHIVVLDYPLGLAKAGDWVIRPNPRGPPTLSLYCNGIAAGDAGPLRGVGTQLNNEIKDAASNFPDVTFEDVAAGFEPHLLCSGGQEWLNSYATLYDPTGTSKFPPKSCPLLWKSSTSCRSSRSFHPNDSGYRYDAGLVTDVIPKLDWSRLYRPPAVTPPVPTPARARPTSAPAPSDACASDQEILAAARQADPSLPDFARVSDRLCDGADVAAWIDQSANGVGVLLHRGPAGLSAVAVSDNPCVNPAVKARSAAIRQFFGC
jgi:hypothetical protein